MSEALSLRSFAEHAKVQALLADGAAHPAKIHIDSSFTEVMIRLHGSKTDLGPIGTDYLSSRLQQNLADAVQHYDEHKWYSTEILAKHNAVDTNEAMHRSARADQANVGISEMPMLDDQQRLPRVARRYIVQLAQTLRAENSSRSLYTISSEIATRVVLRNGERIPNDRILEVVRHVIGDGARAGANVMHFDLESHFAEQRRLREHRRLREQMYQLARAPIVTLTRVSTGEQRLSEQISQIVRMPQSSSERTALIDIAWKAALKLPIQSSTRFLEKLREWAR